MSRAAPLLRADIIYGQGVTEIAFRRRFRWGRLVLMVLVALFWLGGSLFGLLLLAASSAGPSPLFTGLWLFGWIAGGLVAIVLVLWSLVGVDWLVVRHDGVTRVRQLLFAKWPKLVPAAVVTGIDWFADDPSTTVTVNGRKVPQPHIAIATKSGTERLAHGITESEARPAIAAVTQRLVLPRVRVR
jgi:hypothetical protein